MAARTSFLILLASLLSACASMTEGECRGADWYQLGYRDADPYGLRPQIDRYAYECKAWVQASDSDYMRGWVEGYREFNTKMNGSECCR
jgi:hypothetical protein